MSMLQAATARAEWGEPRCAGLRAPGAERGEDGAHASALPMEGGGGGGVRGVRGGAGVRAPPPPTPPGPVFCVLLSVGTLNTSI